MKDVQATLRRIDEEITDRRQKIAYHQVEIARLEDTRTVLMGLAESDTDRARADREARGHVINGHHARPVLIARKEGSGGEDGSASKAAKEGRKPPRRARGLPGGSTDFRRRILQLLKNGEAMTSAEIGNHLGVPAGAEPRKPMGNALYHLRRTGILTRDGENRYHVP